MRHSELKLKSATFIVISLVFLLVGGCTEKIVNNQNGPNIKIPMPAKPTSVDYFTLTVNGDDFDAFTVSMIWQDGFITASVDIPVGQNRTLLIRGYNGDGVLIYSGSTVIDVMAGEPITVDIPVLPSAAMVRIEPYYSKTSANQPFYVDIAAYNLPNLGEIEFAIDTSNTTLTIDSITRPVDWPSAEYSVSEAVNSFWVSSYPSGLVDQNGDGMLLRVYLTASNDWTADSVRQELPITVGWAYDINSATIPLNNIINESGIIDLLRSGRNEIFAGGSANDAAQCVIQNSTGDYLFTGMTYSTGAGLNDIYIVRLNPNGSVKWHQTIGTANYDQGQAIVEAVGGGYFVGGLLNGTRLSDNTASGGDFYVAKIDEDGKVLWQNIGTEAPLNYCNDLIATADGGCVAVGLIDVGFDATEYKVSFRRYLPSGDYAWTPKVFGPAVGDYISYSVAQIDDSNYVIAGRSTSEATVDTDAFLMRVGPRGQLIWTKYYTPEANSLEMITDVEIAADGGFLLCGSSAFGDFDNLFLAEFDMEGNHKWHQMISGAGNTVAEDMKVLRNGSIILAGGTGYSSYWNTDGDVYYAMFTSGGAFNWSRTDGVPGSERIYSIYPTADGGFILGGTSNYHGNQDAYLLKIKSNGDF